MSVAANWVGPLVGAISFTILIVTLVLEAWAFVHCALQRPDAFVAVGTLAKGVWLAILGGTVLLSLMFYSFGPLFTMIAVIASLIYLLDIRPAIRELTNGGGRW